MKIVAFIPAKGSSSRIESKNRQKIFGVPLFLWAANNLNRVLDKQDIYIDSECDEILNTAKTFGFNTIKRPKKLASNQTNGNELLLWQASNVKADIYIQHLPPMIFLKKETIEKGLDAILKNGFKSAFGARKEHLYLWNNESPKYDLRNLPNSFTLPETIIEGMGFYISTKEHLDKTGLRIDEQAFMIELDKYEAIDIDYPQDLEFARIVAKGLGFNSLYTNGIEKIRKKRKIKLLVLDVDGVMSDGGMYYTSDGKEIKKFNTKDGLAIKNLIENSKIEVAFLSSGMDDKIISHRASMLGVKRVYVGSEKKELILSKWIKELNLEAKDIAYVGDDINDLNAMKLCGLKACPSDASDEIKNIADVLLSKKGGEACVREFVDEFLYKE